MANYSEEKKSPFLVVQYKVFSDLTSGNDLEAKRRFLANNAYLFRHFSEHLPDDLQESWDHADQDPASRLKLEEQYVEFHKEVDKYIAKLDHEVQEGLAQAINDGDVDLASYIFENTFGKQ